MEARTMSDTPTPEVDDYFENKIGRYGPDYESVANFARRLERERDEAIKALDFLKSKGLTVGLMTSSDKPEPYLVYVIERDSELCDMRSVNKLVDAETERDKLRAINAELMEALETSDGIYLSESRLDKKKSAILKAKENT
jgi:hypothetical protein